MRTKKLNEAVEKAKIRNLTARDASQWSGVYQLASGKPGKTATCGDIELTLVGGYEDTSIQIVLQDYEDRHGMIYNAFFDDESTAIRVFDSIAKELTDTTSVNKMAKKYDFEFC